MNDNGIGGWIAGMFIILVVFYFVGAVIAILLLIVGLAVVWLDNNRGSKPPPDIRIYTAPEVSTRDDYLDLSFRPGQTRRWFVDIRKYKYVVKGRNTEGDWVYITCHNVDGWAPTKVVDLEIPVMNLPVLSLSLRYKPSLEYGAIPVMNLGDKFVVDGRNKEGDWVCMNYYDYNDELKTGWAPTKDVDLEIPVMNLPVVDF